MDDSTALAAVNAGAATKPAAGHARWTRRLGLAAAALFLVKGLLWLIVPVLVARGLMRPHTDDAAPSATATLQD